MSGAAFAKLLARDPRCGFEVAPDAPPHRGVRGTARVGEVRRSRPSTTIEAWRSWRPWSNATGEARSRRSRAGFVDIARPDFDAGSDGLTQHDVREPIGPGADGPATRAAGL